MNDQPLFIYQESEKTFLGACTCWTLCILATYLNAVIIYKVMMVLNMNCYGTTPRWYLWHLKGLEIICCLSEFRAGLDTELKEEGGSCRMSPMTPWKPHLLTHTVLLGWELPILKSLCLPGKSMHFVILSKIENEASGYFCQTWALLPCCKQHFSKTPCFQPNGWRSIVAMCIFPDYVSKVWDTLL